MTSRLATDRVCAVLVMIAPATAGLLPFWIGAASAAGAILLNLSATRRSPLGSPVAFADALTLLLLWLAMVWVSRFVGGLTGAFPEDSTIAALRLSAPAVFLVASHLCLRGELQFTIKAFATIGVLHAALSVSSGLLGTQQLIGEDSRAAGALTPNILANLLGFLFLSTLFPALRILNVGHVFFFRSALLIIGLGLLYTGTLKNILAVIAIGCLLALRNGGPGRLVKAIYGFIFALSTSALIVFSSAIAVRLERMRDVLHYLSGSGISASEKPSSLLWRLEHWSQLLSDWYENYFWLGSGIGQSVNMRGVRALLQEGAMAHSDWVAILVEGGVLIGSLWVILMALAIRTIRRSIIDPGRRQLFSVLTLYFVVIMIAGNVAYTVPFMYCYWILAGAVMACKEVRRSGSLLPSGFVPSRARG